MKGLWREIAVGVLIIAAASLLAYMSIRVGTLRVPGARTYVLRFDDAAGLVSNSPVTVAGIKVGSVETMVYEDKRARVTVRVSPDVTLQADARASIRARSLLGEKYIALEPGVATGTLADGAEIPTIPTADIDRLLSAVATIAEAADPEDVAGLVHGLNELLNAKTADGMTLPDAAAEIAASMTRVAKKAEQLADDGSAAAKRVGPALASVEAATKRLTITLERVDPAVEDLPEAVERLNRVLAQLDEILEKNKDLSQESIVNEIRKIATQEGIYVRLRPAKDKK